MKFDLVVAGLGGQGVLTLARIIGHSAMSAGLRVVQSEVHGMSERGGAVAAHIRIASHEIATPAIGRHEADLLIGLEPLETLSYLDWLSPAGTLITTTDPVKNIPNYPDVTDVLWSILRMPRGHLVDATRLAREAGGTKTSNVVLLGAATDFLPVDADQITASLRVTLAPKGEQVVKANLDAYEAGRKSLHHKEVVDEFETFAAIPN